VKSIFNGSFLILAFEADVAKETVRMRRKSLINIFYFIYYNQ